MKSKILYLLIGAVTTFILFISPTMALGTSGACSYHSGANCSIGSIDGRAVCNDGWLSSVAYSDMEECVGYGSSCRTYLYKDEFNSAKSSLKNQLTMLGSEIDQLKAEINKSYIDENQAILEYEKSLVGRGITRAGAQPGYNEIYRKYDLLRQTLLLTLELKINEYNQLVNQYNGICRKYYDSEKSLICSYNFGSGSSYIGGVCSVPTPIKTPTSPVYVPQYVAPEPVPTSSNVNKIKEDISKDPSLCKFTPWSYEPECVKKPTVIMTTPPPTTPPPPPKKPELPSEYSKPIQQQEEMKKIEEVMKKEATSSEKILIEKTRQDETPQLPEKPKTFWQNFTQGVGNFFRKFKFW